MNTTQTKKYQKVLVTGGRGFIGAKVVKRLGQKGYTVHVYDQVDGCELMDERSVFEAVKNADVVFHIAAEADLTKMAGSPTDGADGVMNNVYATDIVAQACAEFGVWMIYASTLCVYGNQTEHPSLEDKTLPNPSELYACSKYAGEWIVRGYGYNFGMPWTIQRYATIYGPGMRPALGLHIFFKQALANKPITVHGNGRQVRTLTYIDDLVSGIVAALDSPKLAQNEVFNLTADTPISAYKMACDVRNITRSRSSVEFIEQRPNQTYNEVVSNDKAKTMLGWQPETQWEEGLLKTYEWMKNQK